MDKVPSDDAEAAAGRCCDGADHDVGTGANGSSSPSAASRAAAHASTAHMVCQPLLGPQEAQATPGHRSPLGWVTSYVTVFTVGMGGGTCLGRAVVGTWSPSERQHINLLELQAVFLSGSPTLHPLDTGQTCVRTNNHNQNCLKLISPYK